MPINGFNKTTLLDYPGQIASTIFLGGCNFRCPFCQNSSLVLSPNKQPVISTEEVLSVLKKRQGILEGICITGGEPTSDKDLFLLIDKIKELGYPVVAGIDIACRDQFSIGFLPVGINRWRFLTPLRYDITAKVIIQPSLYHSRH